MMFTNSYKTEIEKTNATFTQAAWAKSLVLLAHAILDVAYEATEKKDAELELQRLKKLYDIWELKLIEVNKAFEEGFNVKSAGNLPAEIYEDYYSPLWDVKPTLCGLIWDIEDQIGL